MEENKIRGLVLGCYPTVSSFANATGWTRQKASRIIDGKQEPSLNDIYDISVAVKKDATFVASIFLEQKTQKCV